MSDEFEDFLDGKNKRDNEKEKEEDKIISDWLTEINRFISNVRNWLGKYEDQGKLEITEYVAKYQNRVEFPSLTIKIHGQIIYITPQTGGFMEGIQREIHIHTHVNQNLRKIDFFQDKDIWKIKVSGDIFNNKAQELTEESFKRILQGLATE